MRRGIDMRHAILTAITTAALAAGLLAPTAAQAAGAPPGRCAAGEFCVWTGTGHTGRRYVWELATAGIESCVALPAGTTGRSFANRAGRPVTAYQDRTCSTEGEFDTYPGHGTWVPESPFAVRAFKIWER
jgi:Peptidase inhibitor family I36